MGLLVIERNVELGARIPILAIIWLRSVFTTKRWCYELWLLYYGFFSVGIVTYNKLEIMSQNVFKWPNSKSLFVLIKMDYNVHFPHPAMSPMTYTVFS